MKKTVIILMITVLFSAAVTVQSADITLGIGVGDSLHFTGRMDLDRTRAAVLNVGFGYGYSGGLYLRPQYQFEMAELEFDIDVLRFYPYFGAALPIGIQGDFSGVDMGVSAVAGISYFFDETPIELYIEALPGVRLFRDGKFHSGFGIGGGIGIRYGFGR